MRSVGFSAFLGSLVLLPLIPSTTALAEADCKALVAPGAVKTPIWGKTDGINMSAYQNSPYLPALERIRQFLQHLSQIALPPERIATRIADVLTSARPRVRYEITPDPMRHLITGILPKRMVDRIIAKRLGLLPPA